MNTLIPVLGRPRPGYLFGAMLLVLAVGCHKSGELESPPDDEGMLRAKAENKTPEVAAKEYYLPKYYYDASKGDYEQRVPNYFRGMDQVVVEPGALTPNSEDPRQPHVNVLQTPVFQLLDQDTPAFQAADPVETNLEILGRNTWMLWCGGNEGFWDWLAGDNLGFIDLLKLVDTRNRATRFDKAGMINEPGMMQSGGPAPDEFGLWLDKPVDGETLRRRQAYLKHAFDLIRDGKHASQRGSSKYPEAAAGHAAERPDQDYSKAKDEEYGGEYDELSETFPLPDIYGVSTGVVGLRLFPNPNFDAEAQKNWDAERYYSDRDYYSNPKLVRPFRVGMACAFCHASFHPLNPPLDAAEPSWANISGNIGAQYLRVRATFANLIEPDNFIYHVLDSQPPGTIDTSLIASDNINNPNSMNSIFNLPQRALLSLRNPQETLGEQSGSQPSIWKTPNVKSPQQADDKVPEFWRKAFAGAGLEKELDASNGNPRAVPRILFDGADSIGAWGALSRVYLNIGTYYEQWIRLHRVVVGFQPQKPFTIVDCRRHSLYWHGTQDRVAALRDYFLKVSPPMPLGAVVTTERVKQGMKEANRAVSQAVTDEAKSAAASQLETALSAVKDDVGKYVDSTKLAHGRKVFARNCIVCHSSIQPDNWFAAMREQANGGELWLHDPAHWLSDPDYLKWAETEVEKKEFWRLNYLSNDYRIPVNMVHTNAGRALATNALHGNMWDDFASESYQNMPSVGAIDFFDPYLGPNGGMSKFNPRHKVGNGAQPGGGGPGFYRVPTLVSIWSTAPLLHNNSLGEFTNNPSVSGRLRAFDDAIRKLLWPEKRLESSDYATAEQLQRDHGLIWRTPCETTLTISGRRVPSLLAGEVPVLMKVRERYAWLDRIQPAWLPSALLLLASFAFLLADTPAKRRQLGLFSVGISLLAGLVFGLLHGALGWWPALACIRPIWLTIAVPLAIGVIALALDFQGVSRCWACALLGVAAITIASLALGWWCPGWLAKLGKIVSLPWLGVVLLLVITAILLTVAGKRLRISIGLLTLAVALLGVFGFVARSNSIVDATGIVNSLWAYSPILAAIGLMLLTPDRQAVHRFTGYAALFLSLAAGTATYFFRGEIGDLVIGPIPKGTPVNLLANLNPDADPQDIKRALDTTIEVLAEIRAAEMSDQETQDLLRTRVAPELMKVNKCPDFVMDRGHYFPWFDQMTDEDKEALVELLKTF